MKSWELGTSTVKQTKTAERNDIVADITRSCSTDRI